MNSVEVTSVLALVVLVTLICAVTLQVVFGVEAAKQILGYTDLTLSARLHNRWL